MNNKGGVTLGNVSFKLFCCDTSCPPPPPQKLPSVTYAATEIDFFLWQNRAPERYKSRGLRQRCIDFSNISRPTVTPFAMIRATCLATIYVHQLIKKKNAQLILASLLRWPLRN